MKDQDQKMRDLENDIVMFVFSLLVTSADFFSPFSFLCTLLVAPDFFLEHSIVNWEGVFWHVC